MNRIHEIVNGTQASARLRNLAKSIADSRTNQLNPDEIITAEQLAEQGSDMQIREELWRILSLSRAPDSVIKRAADLVLDATYEPRWAAFQYLRSISLAEAKRITEGNIPSADLDLQYVVADFLLEVDKSKGLSRMIKLISSSAPMDHALFESASMAIATNGTERELNKLNLMDKLGGGRTPFGQVAKMLEFELSNRKRKV
jgi:hypothetical protein